MIVNLKVSNFKGIEKAEINCKKVTIFVGDNRQGKSSMLNSIGWCIAGGNKPYNVMNNKDEARVVASTERATFDRVLVRGSKKDRIVVTKKLDGSIVEASVALSSFNDNCFDPIKFVFIEPKIQSKIIREALAGKMTLTDQEVKDFGLTPDTTKDAKTLCEEAYKRYYNERTEINRQVDTMKQKMAGAALDFIPDQKFIDILENQVKELNDRFNEQIKKNARIKAAQDNKVTYQKLQDQLTVLEKEIATTEEHVGKAEDNAEEVILELKKKFNKESVEETEQRGFFNAIKKTLTELETGAFPVCPISKKISCQTDMTNIKEGMRTEQIELGEKLKKLHDSNLALSEHIDSLEQHIKNKKTIAAKKIEYDRTKAMLDNLTIADETLENDEATKTQLNQKQQELSTAKIAKDLAALGDIEEKVKRQRNLDALVKKLRDFIDVELTKRAKIEVHDIEVKEDGIYFRGIPLSEECTSLQLRASCAIMKNLYPKNKLLLADRLEILDRKSLTQFLTSYAINTEGLQLFGTFVGDFEHLKNIPDVQLIEMKAGVPVEV